MQSNLPIPAWSQRDPRWSGQRLGTQGSQTTIGQTGCLVTSISMMNAGLDPDNQLTPNQVDDVFSDNGGYANANLVVWNAINRLLPNCSTTGQIFCENSPAPVGDIKAHLDAGQLAILQVGFGGNPSNMHFLLALGYNGDDIVFNDPWYGDRASFSSGRYGSGNSASDILAIHYFADGVPPVKPASPVAARPSEQPLLGFQRVVRDGVNVNYRKEPNQNSEVIKLFNAGDILDFKGFVHGEKVTENDVWYVGKYSNGYAFSDAFSDNSTHDLEDLTPQAPTPEPEATPVPVVVTPEPVGDIPEAPVVTDITPPQPTATDWAGVLAWRPEPEKERTVTNPKGADVVDLTSGAVITHLPVGTVIHRIAGAVTYQGKEWIRTQFSVDHVKWNGVNKEDLSTPTVEVPVTTESADEVFKDQSSEQVERDFQALGSAVVKNRRKIGAVIRELLAILVAPILKRIGRKE